MASSAEISAVTDIILRVFNSDPVVFEASLQAIKVNTEKVTLDNQIAAIRKEMALFIETKEAEIQALLGLK